MDEFDDTLLLNFDRYQETNQVWVQVGNQTVVQENHFIEQWGDEKKRQVVGMLRECTRRGGVVLGAFEGDNLVGFANLQPELFGSERQYVELHYMHVSAGHRDRGVGRRLFELCCIRARRLGALKLYVGAHPSVETQEFYRALGCTLAQEVNQRTFQREPTDIQLEYAL